MVYCKQFPINSAGRRVRFFDVTSYAMEALRESSVRNGILVAYSQHTSCSVFIQEDSEDKTFWDVPLVLQDMLNIFDKIVPLCVNEGQYLHPGPIHTENAVQLRNEQKAGLLNTDAHLRSVMLGRSESIPIVDGELNLGEFGRIYFADFDQTRDRDRCFRVQIVGEK